MYEELGAPRNFLLDPMLPEEALARGFQVTEHTVISNKELGFSFKFIHFVDYDGKQITLPMISETKRENDIKDALHKYGHEVKPMEVTELNISRFNYCIQKLKSPTILATRIAFDRLDIDLSPEKFPVPDKDAPQTIIIGIRSLSPSSGKSLLGAIMKLHSDDILVYSTDVFSGIGPEEYGQIFRKKQFTIDTPVHELIVVGEEIREPGKRPPKTVGLPPFGDLLDKMINDIKISPKRESFILMEGMSIPGKNITYDAYALATAHSFDAHAFLDQPQFGPGPWKDRSTGKIIYPLNINLDHFGDPGLVLEKFNLLANQCRAETPTPLLPPATTHIQTPI